MSANGWALGAVADFGAQNCQYTTNVDARYNVQLTTSPAIAAKRLLCAALLFYMSVCQSFSVGFLVCWLGGSFAKLA